jgi:hypothetical protein
MSDGCATKAFMAQVRFFAQISPVTDPWGSIASKYLKTLTGYGLTVRVVPIGPFFLSAFHRPDFAHWEEHLTCFTGELDQKYVNIVCAPTGLSLGPQLSVEQLAPRAPMGVEGNPMGGHHTQRPDGPQGVVYEPETAITGLWVKGQQNIAITGTRPTAPSDAELNKLREYDLVVAPTPEEAADLHGQGVSVSVVSPGEPYLAQLTDLVRTTAFTHHGGQDAETAR